MALHYSDDYGIVIYQPSKDAEIFQVGSDANGWHLARSMAEALQIIEIINEMRKETVEGRTLK